MTCLKHQAILNHHLHECEVNKNIEQQTFQQKNNKETIKFNRKGATPNFYKGKNKTHNSKKILLY
jgi:hypothetical protein